MYRLLKACKFSWWWCPLLCIIVSEKCRSCACTLACTEIFVLYPTNKEMKIEEFQNIQNFRVRSEHNKQSGQVIIERMSCKSWFSESYAWIITYSKCSNLCQMSKLSSNFGCLFTFFQLIVLIQSDHINSTKSILILLNKSHFNLFDLK